jgi:hypothetical protein
MNTAFQKALDQVGDAFREERKLWQGRIMDACQLKQLVTEHRYTFPQALEELEARVDWMLEAFDLVKLDNFTLNAKYDTEIHAMPEYQLVTERWLRQITGNAS